MPIYEYLCKRKHFFIKHISMGERKMIERCPRCGEPALLQMSRANIDVKNGTGRFHG